MVKLNIINWRPTLYVGHISLFFPKQENNQTVIEFTTAYSCHFTKKITTTWYRKKNIWVAFCGY
jgi:hypothetical protein